jgi:mannosyltransferase
MQPTPTSNAGPSVRLRLATIILLGAVVRFVFLGARSFWGDEIVSVKLAADTWHAFTYWILRREANMALYYLLLRGWVRLGDSETWVRLLSAILGILTIPALYLLARRLQGERAACIAALLAATSACMVQFSQDARSYSMLMLLVVISYYCFVRFLDDESPWPAALYVIISGCALYTHFFAALIICSQIVSLAWLPPKQLPWRRLAAVYAALAISAVPIGIYILRNDVGQLYWVQPTTFSEVAKLFVFFAGASKGVAAVLAVISLSVCGIAVARFGPELRSRGDHSWRFALVLTWALVPALLTILLSLHKPVFVHRYLLISLPGYLLLIAVGLERLKGKVLAAMMTAFVALSAVSIVQGYFRPIEDWRGAVSYVLKSREPGDALLTYIPYGSNNFNFYGRRILGTKQDPPFAYIDSSKPPAQIENASAPRAWLILYPSPHVAELAPAFESAFAARYEREQRTEFKGISVLLVSSLRPPTSPHPTESAPHR